MADLIGLVYFSATGVTKACAEVIRDELLRLGCEAELVDVTSFAARSVDFSIDRFDGLIFGFPVYADFAPSVINEWIPTLDGRGRRCATFFTYGARTTGYAHFHTKLLLENAGFCVQFSAEFLGRHTFNVAGWRVLPDRPDEQDFAAARQYAALAIERFSEDIPTPFHLQKPFRYGMTIEQLENREKRTERGWCNPVRVGETCSMCRRCETECPNQAFDADTGLSDPAKCIECMHCVYICPDGVLGVDERMEGVYEVFLEDWHLTEEIMRAKKSKIITEAWQAAH